MTRQVRETIESIGRDIRKNEEEEKNMTKWAVKTVDYYADECYKDSLWVEVRLFDTKSEAVEYLNSVIRDGWTTEVCVDGEIQSLAYCRGKSEVDSVKYSAWYYSEDGETAWAFYSDGSGHKGEVVEMEVEV